MHAIPIEHSTVYSHQRAWQEPSWNFLKGLWSNIICISLKFLHTFVWNPPIGYYNAILGDLVTGRATRMRTILVFMLIEHKQKRPSVADILWKVPEYAFSCVNNLVLYMYSTSCRVYCPAHMCKGQSNQFCLLAICLSVFVMKIARSPHLGIWATCRYDESVEIAWR